MHARLVLLLIATTAASAQTIQVSKDNKTIAITATDSATLPADTADISIGFTTYGTAQDPTYAACSTTSNKIITTLTEAGLPKAQIVSNEQHLNPIEADDKLHFDKGFRFVCSQSWKVTTAAQNAANTLNLAITAGANNSGNIEWRLADDNALDAEAAQKALAHAQQIASQMAKGLGSKLGTLIYASNQAPSRFGGPLIQAESAMIMRKVEIKPLAILPDKVTRSATVYAVFSVE